MKTKIGEMDKINVEQIKRHSDFFMAKFTRTKVYIPRMYDKYSAS